MEEFVITTYGLPGRPAVDRTAIARAFVAKMIYNMPTTRINEGSTVERVNGRLKDEFGGRMVRVRGHSKVMCHLMFGIVALTVNQLMCYLE